MAAKSKQNPLNSKRFSAREAILDASVRVVAEMGAGHMTLDAVAQEAGVSKGGLLYHFPSKEALLTAMVERHVDHLTEAEQARAINDKSSLLCGFIRSRLTQRPEDPESARIMHGMIAAMTERPALLDPLREHHKRLWQVIKQTNKKPEHGLIAWLALDGLLFQEAFNASPLSADERARAVDAILRIAETAE